MRSQPTGDDSIGQSRILIIRPEEPDSPRILHRYANHIVIDPVTDKRFAAASDRAIEEFEIPNGELLGKIGDVPRRVLDMNYTPDGTHIAACGVIGQRDPRTGFRNSDPGRASIYHRESQQVLELKGHTAVVTSIAIDAPRNRCAKSSHDGTIRLWEMQTGECLHVYRGHHSDIASVDISTEGRLLPSAGADGIAVWNIAGVVDTKITPVEIAQEFILVDSGSDNQSAAPDLEPIDRRSTPAKNTQRWDVVEVGDVSRVNWNNNAVEPWMEQNSNANAAFRITEIPPHRAHPPSAFASPASVSRDGNRRLYTELNEPAVKIFDAEDHEIQSRPIRVDRRHAVISPDGKIVFILRQPDREGPGKIQIDLYDVETGDRLRTIEGGDARWATALKIDPMGKTLLVHFDNNSIDVRNIATGQSLAVLESTPVGAGRSSQYSPDGRWIAIGKYLSTDIVLYDSSGVEPIQTIVNDLPVRWFRFTPDGQRLIAGQP